MEEFVKGDVVVVPFPFSDLKNTDYPVELAQDDNGTKLATFPDVPEAITFCIMELYS
jgi:hypothetical protein